VSSAEQSLDAQREKLSACNKIFEEIQDSTADRRPCLKACLVYLREGDTLVVTCLDRLARFTLHLCQVAAELERKQVHLRVLAQDIDTGDETGHEFFNMLRIIKQFETELRVK
jgi:DNA invertase Pin-like site-specific DNA recombinase